MTARAAESLDDRNAAALAELAALITARYPGATIEVRPGEEPGERFLMAAVDLEDPDEVLDLVLDRLLDFQVGEGLPILVVPLRSPQAEAAYRERVGLAP